MEQFQSYNITSADAGNTVSLGSGDYTKLHTVVINKTDATHTLTIEDGAGTTKGTIKAAIAEGSLIYDITVSGQLKIVVPSGYAGDATVSYR